MIRKIRIAAASVMVAAGLIGAVATPASAGAPQYSYSFFCQTSFGTKGEGPATGPKREVKQQLRQFQPGCLDGTLETNITRL